MSVGKNAFFLLEFSWKYETYKMKENIIQVYGFSKTIYKPEALITMSTCIS